jgi:hypothetical protein
MVTLAKSAADESASFHEALSGLIFDNLVVI